jgi:hypothetical protein
MADMKFSDPDIIVEQSRAIARWVLANIDRSGWREAGYACAINAARIVIGNFGGKQVAECAAGIVAERLCEIP